MSNLLTTLLALILGFFLAFFFIKPKVETKTKYVTNIVYKDTVITNTVFKPKKVYIKDIVTKYQTVKTTDTIYKYPTYGLPTRPKYKQYVSTYDSPLDSNVVEIYSVVQSNPDTVYNTIQWLKNPEPKVVIVRDTINTTNTITKYKSGFTAGASISQFYFNPNLGFLTKKGHLISIGAATNYDKLKIFPTIQYLKIISK